LCRNAIAKSAFPKGENALQIYGKLEGCSLKKDLPKTYLQPPEWVAALHSNVAFHVTPESQNHVNNNRRAQREERNIDEPKPDAAGSNAHAVAHIGANPKGFPLDKLLYFKGGFAHDADELIQI
jgi:hypothetical protein